jgi:hypothetical protein
MHSTFISYAHAEEPNLLHIFANVVTDLSWYDRRELRPEEAEWAKIIIDVLANVLIVLVVGDLWTEGYITKLEVMFALAMGKIVVFLPITSNAAHPNQ